MVEWATLQAVQAIHHQLHHLRAMLAGVQQQAQMPAAAVDHRLRELLTHQAQVVVVLVHQILIPAAQ
jgi:hypothetical protein